MAAQIHDDDQIINISQLSDWLGIKVRTVYSRRDRRPWQLPPSCSPAGSRLLWRCGDVREWLNKQKEISKANSDFEAEKNGVLLVPLPPPRRPGRPKKSVQVARRARNYFEGLT